ncbi:MAG: conserved membrane protein of unknown function [Promethearchaeota archaeon]|nr:MAG: conserved membrane protein of unknown function [Candidatus Lokiarchaeota archaeon]
MSLSLVEGALGLITLLFMVLSIYLGRLCLKKCTKYKSWETVYIAVSWISLTFFWNPAALKFIFLLFNIIIDPGIFLWIFSLTGAMLLPVAVTLWLTSLLNIMISNQAIKQIILSILLILNTTFLILLFLLLIGRSSLVGAVNSSYSVDWAPFVEVFFIYSIILISLTGVYFFYKYVTLENEPGEAKNKIRNHLPELLFLLFSIFGIIDTLNSNIIVNLIMRIFLILILILFYIGFVIPVWYHKSETIKEKEK